MFSVAGADHDVPVAHEAFVSGKDLEASLRKDSAKIGEGVKAVPVVTSPGFSCVRLLLSPGASHGPVVNSGGCMCLRVIDGAADECLRLTIGESFAARMESDDSALVPGGQSYSLHNTGKKACKIDLVVSH